MKYDELYKLVENFNISKKEFENLHEEFSNNKKDDIKGVLTFTDFIYYYISEMNNTYFHNYNSIGYTLGFIKLLNLNNIKIDFDFSFYLSNEEKYDEILIDILQVKINEKLRKENLIIIGINVGFDNTVYFIIPYEKYVELKKIKTELFSIIDTYYSESIYNEIYELKNDFEGLKKGHFVMLDNKEIVPIYITLFNEYHHVNKKYSVPENIKEDVLELVL